MTFSSNAGVGNGSVSYTVAANTNGPTRVANINVLGQIFTITQSAASCYVILGLSNSWFNQISYSNLSLPVFSNCAWTVTASPSWITASPASGSNNGSITYSIAANSGATRSGTITVNTQTYTINQLGGPGGISSCTFSLSSQSESFGKDGGSSSVLVTTQDGCDWTVTNPNSWITLTSGQAGRGVGVIGYTIQRNTTGVSRSGTLTFATQSLSILQSAN